MAEGLMPREILGSRALAHFNDLRIGKRHISMDIAGTTKLFGGCLDVTQELDADGLA